MSGIYMDPYRDWRPVTEAEVDDPNLVTVIEVARRRVRGLPVAAALHAGGDNCMDIITMLASAYVQGVYDTAAIVGASASKKEDAGT